MDDGPMWSKDPCGNYCLLFSNKHALPKDEIKRIFSAFGEVKSVNVAGDEKGYRFIQYLNVEDAERAVEGLKDHPTVTLIRNRPPKHKKNQNSKVKQSSESKQSNNNYKKNLYQRKHLHGNNEQLSKSLDSHNANNCTNINDTQSLFQNNINLDYQENNDNVSVSSKVSDRSANSRKQNGLENDKFNQMSLSKSLDFNNQLSSKKNIDQFKKFSKLKSFSISSSNGSCNDIYSSKSSIVDDEIPDLVTKNKNDRRKESKITILNAEEILVANIHHDYGSAYILHLFDEFEPLAVSYVKNLPQSEIRYCHVYFKNLQDSLGVEKQFDKYNLDGKNLIVLRSSRLLNEVKI